MSFKYFRTTSFVQTKVLIGVISMLIGCSSAEYIPEKMDATLKQRISFLEKEEPNSFIQFTGKTNSSINDEMKTELEATGIKVESIIQDVFTAAGTAESIKKTTLLDFVIFLELAKKMDMK